MYSGEDNQSYHAFGDAPKMYVGNMAIPRLSPATTGTFWALRDSSNQRVKNHCLRAGVSSKWQVDLLSPGIAAGSSSRRSNCSIISRTRKVRQSHVCKLLNAYVQTNSSCEGLITSRRVFAYSKYGNDGNDLFGSGIPFRDSDVSQSGGDKEQRTVYSYCMYSTATLSLSLSLSHHHPSRTSQ